MTSATAALQSLEAHRQVLDKERNDMKDDIAFLRDLRRRYTLPLSELPPCKGLPAPVASSARKFLVDTEAYIMRRISANQKQDAEIGNQSEQLRGTIQQTANIAHQIAGTTPSHFAPAPGGGGYNNNNNQYHHNQGGNINTSNIQTPSYNTNSGSNQQQQQYNNGNQYHQSTSGTQPQIGFSEAIGSPGGASRYTNISNRGGGGAGGGNNTTNFSGASPMPQQQQFARGPSTSFSSNNNNNNNAEIGFEAPLGVLPYMSAASAAYRQQQALAYLAADQGVLPRGWAPAPLNPQPLVPYNGVNNNGGVGGGSRGVGGNMSPSRMRAMEMSGFGHGGGGAGGVGSDGTTFVVLPRASSTERPASVNKRRAGSASRR